MLEIIMTDPLVYTYTQNSVQCNAAYRFIIKSKKALYIKEIIKTFVGGVDYTILLRLFLR
jgi:hypothetical protein